VQLNLSRVHLLLGNRRKAVAALETGLKIHAGYDALLRLREEIGFRRPPVIGFLSRDNILNQVLGRMRHAFREWWTERQVEKARSRSEKS
jgi:hypothetical protein